MKWVIDKKLKEVDDVFWGLFKYLNLIKHVTPINVEEEKKVFFSRGGGNPVFKYKSVRTNISKIRQMLEELDIPLTNLGKVYERVRSDFFCRCEIIENIGVNDSVVREVSSRMHGWPNDGCLDYAKRILKEIPNIEIELDVSAGEVCDSLRRKLHDVGLDGWVVKYSKKRLTRTKHTRKILVCEERMFSKLDVSRLPVHEVEVHAMRYENGYFQPLKIFGYGFPDFLRTEEGLATYFEELTGNSSGQIFRNYAGRVMAIDCLKRGLNFRECFFELKKYNFSDDEAWNLAVRVYRGGGFVKDHVYLEGYLMVKRFVLEGGDLKKLFVGKVGLDDLYLVEDLLSSGVINEAKFLPGVLKLAKK